MRLLFIILLATCFLKGRSQFFISTDSIGAATQSANIYNKALSGDSLATSFCIVIKNEVKPHKHLTHSEHVVVLAGEGTMKLGDRTFGIKSGDVIFIPKNTVHGVRSTGTVPLKVISVQAPLFNGSDRVMVEDQGK